MLIFLQPNITGNGGVGLELIAADSMMGDRSDDEENNFLDYELSGGYLFILSVSFSIAFSSHSTKRTQFH